MTGGERFFYRASDKLAADLRAYAVAREAFLDEVVRPWMVEHPDHEPIQNSWSQRALGFRDGRPNDPPPEGLSRAQSRDYLIPKRGKSGEPWRQRLAKFDRQPKRDDVFDKHAVPTQQLTGNRLCLTSFVDLNDDTVVVYSGAELSSPALAPMKRSEFYALHEAAMERDGETGVRVMTAPDACPPVGVLPCPLCPDDDGHSHLPRLYRGVVWADVVADIRDAVTVPSDGTAEHVVPVSTEVPW